MNYAINKQSNHSTHFAVLILQNSKIGVPSFLFALHQCHTILTAFLLHLPILCAAGQTDLITAFLNYVTLMS